MLAPAFAPRVVGALVVALHVSESESMSESTSVSAIARGSDATFPGDRQCFFELGQPQARVLYPECEQPVPDDVCLADDVSLVIVRSQLADVYQPFGQALPDACSEFGKRRLVLECRALCLRCWFAECRDSLAELLLFEMLSSGT